MKAKAKTPKLSKQKRKDAVRFVFLGENRGLLPDVVVFLVNLFLMQLLLTHFLTVAYAASEGNFLAGVAMFLFVPGYLFCRRLARPAAVFSTEDALSGGGYRQVADVGDDANCKFSNNLQSFDRVRVPIIYGSKKGKSIRLLSLI